MAPLPPDPYKILGVTRDAQTPEIRSCYRKLVLKCHPDKVQDPKLKEEKQNEFQRVQQAYELLSNDNERQRYDDKVKLEDLRRQMKEKAQLSSPKPSPKYSGEFEIRTPEMRSSTFKASPSPGKTYTFSRYEDDYGVRDARIFETKSRSSSKRETSFSERYSKREVEREKEREREKEKDKDRDRDRRRKEEDARRSKVAKEVLKAEKKRQEKQRDRDIKRDTDEKLRQRFAKVSVESYDDEPSKSERKRSSRKADDKGGRSSPRDEKQPSSSSRPPLATNRFHPYSNNDRVTYDRAATYMEASRAPPPPLYRSSSYSGRSPHIPAAPSPPPTSKKAFVSDETDSDDNVRRSAAPSRRGSGDGPRLSRERSSYRKPSNEVLEDHIPASASPAARHSTSFNRSAANSPHMASSPPRYDLPRVNSMPQPVFSRPGPGLTRAHTLGVSGEHTLPRGRERNRMHSQVESSESDEEFDRYDRERRHRGRRTQSPEPMPTRDHVSRFEVENGGGRRSTRRVPAAEADTGHAYYMHGQPIRVSETRMPANYREANYTSVPTARGYGNPKTSKYHDIQYSDHYGPYRDAVRA